ncbi:uncharacterized protein LOC143178279 [Calliopsis andreniformis]|uniref:uncharacterized protein LOC143178279 n=1 Tax=Calliopsis andreniformis TaxID=337506 RepID=UPI003FCE6FAD
MELHGFCDASLAAYSAVTYLRVTTMNNEVFTSLLMAKTRVTPIKTQSIPVLELNGAVLLAKLIVHVRKSLSLPIDRVVCWTDSTIALAWLKKHPSTWTVVVANRVSKIQTFLPSAEWRYVPTRSNPADLNSRGIEAADFLQSRLWMFGPGWLSGPEVEWPTMPASVETTESKCIAHAHVTTPKPEWEFLFRFQTWRKLLRVTAYCLRWRKQTRADQGSPDSRVIEASELRIATERIVRHIQGTYFAEEYRCLKIGRGIPEKSPLKSLNPFLDENDVLMVGGRLDNATLAWETKHPIILPKHYVSTLIIRQCHVDTLHGGLQLTLHTVRQSYWILGCRNAAKTVVKKCMRCVRWRSSASTQIMQHLVPARCRPAKAFDNCGVDYAGPYRVRDSAGRGKTAHKAYIAVFVCYATRAVHIELVHDYTTNAFLAALDRFVARRGIPSCIFSDNGTNFVGANRELRKQFCEAFSSTEMQNKCGSMGIRWRFNPPSAPHFGGMQEAGVKSVKHHLKRTLGEFTPTGEEMQTLLCKIEASLNSRPIAPLSDHPDDYAPLTPGHFLTGGPLNAIPLQSVETEKLSRLSHWRAIQKFHGQLWSNSTFPRRPEFSDFGNVRPLPEDRGTGAAGRHPLSHTGEAGESKGAGMDPGHGGSRVAGAGAHPRTTRRYLCAVPGGRYVLRWDKEQRLTSLLWRPAVVPQPTAQKPTTRAAPAGEGPKGRRPSSQPGPKSREERRRRIPTSTTSPREKARPTTGSGRPGNHPAPRGQHWRN